MNRSESSKHPNLKDVGKELDLGFYRWKRGVFERVKEVKVLMVIQHPKGRCAIFEPRASHLASKCSGIRAFMKFCKDA